MLYSTHGNLEEMNTIAIIPARGGSKRIPNKNIRLFFGQPIISYSIKTAIETGIFDEVIVSTDDEEIASVSREFGASVFGLRPLGISDDKTGVLQVVAYELAELAKKGKKPDEICLIFATAPLMCNQDIVESYEVFRNSQKDFVFAAAEFTAPISRAFTILKDGTAKMLQPENYYENSQDLPTAYFGAGQFCWGRSQAMMEPEPVVYSERGIPFLLPANRVVDIDTIDDWDRAEWFYQAHQALSTE